MSTDNSVRKPNRLKNFMIKKEKGCVLLSPLNSMYFHSTGGEVANSHEFPHQALLGYNKGNPKEWLCGGSLISKQFVLTGKLRLSYA